MIAAGAAVLLIFNTSFSPLMEMMAGPAPSASPTGSSLNHRQETTGPTVQLISSGFASWAMLDRNTGTIVGSSNMADPSDTMSMIKAWLAADYLRQQTGYPTPRTLARLSIMIRDSNNPAANEFYRLNGRDASILRMILICGLTDSQPAPNRWSNTVISARDVTRLGACLADGRATGPIWQEWLLNEMRMVRGAGNFGPRLAFPEQVAAGIAIKNGWLLRDEDKLWHIACLAVSEQWSIGVLLRYPANLGFSHGQTQCRSVAAQLFPAQ
jgi:hypothetical protein